MKKAGIVTFHHALSYGAQLQTYALQQFLFCNGIDNQVVNYRCKFVEDRAHPLRYIRGRSWKDHAASLYYAPRITAFRKKVETFDREYLVMTAPCGPATIAQRTKDMDVLIAGSDQVFSPSCVGFDPVYFLDFAESDKKYAYAASFGTGTIPPEKKAAYRERLKDFQQISVREESGVTLVRELAGKPAQVHADPTFLLTKEQWDKFLPHTAREPYIFLFQVLKPKRLDRYALELSKQTGLPILCLNYRHKVRDKRITYIDSVPANVFVELVRNAEYVCTNSFHGNVFSLIYHKRFIVETDAVAVKNSRSRELMERLGLSSRVLAGENWPDISQATDWQLVDGYIERERERSRAYLLAAAK